MGKGKRFDKKSATTYTVVHRSHEDSLYYDNDASRHVLVQLPSKTGKNKASDASTVPDLVETPTPKSKEVQLRENEGFAAQYGIFYDDSKYDYLQHLKPMGQEGGVFIEATKPKPTVKENFENLLQDHLPSKETRKVTLDETENIPEDLRGFNPDMDPRLREVLEALEDEAYLEDVKEAGEDGEDFFNDLLRSGEAGDEDFYDDEDYDEWDMDNHQDEFEQYDEYDLDYQDENGEEVALENPYNEGEAPEGLEPDVSVSGPVTVNSAWERDFKRFAQSSRSRANDWDSDNEFEDEEEEADNVGELPAIRGKKKNKNALRKKMGAMTDTTSFSMSSSANFRTKGLQLLDDRYEQMATKFEERAERNNKEFNYQNERPDLENMLDDFLETYELDRGGRTLMKKDAKLDAIKQAADSVSKGKLAARRRREQLAVDSLGSSFKHLGI